MKLPANQLDAALKAAGYKFLGWQNGWRSIMLDKDGNETDDPKQYVKHGGYDQTTHPEWFACRQVGHTRDNVQHNPRGSENTVSCDICKIYWKYDCSD